MFISSILLIMSHHLTTYFYLLSLVFIVFVENASKKEWAVTFRQDIFYILVFSGLVFSYWAFIAKPVYESFMGNGLSIGPIVIASNFVIILFYIFFLSLFMIIWLKRRLNFYISREKPTSKYCTSVFLVTVIVSLIIMGIFSFVNMPWVNFSFTLLSIIYSVPLIIIIGLGVAGIRYMRFVPNGYFIRGWFLAILVSFTYGLIRNSSVFLPHRHLEYLMIPLSILSIYGLNGILLNLNYESLSRIWKNINLPVSNSLSYPHSGTLLFYQCNSLLFFFLPFV